MRGVRSADVELVLDVSGLRDPPDSPGGFLELWNQLEPALTGRDLRDKPVHRLDGAAGTITLEVARLADGVGRVTPATRFSIVAVRERSHLLHPCRQCAAEGIRRYGPFVCSAARQEDAGDRVCDKHACILDGALTATCGEHRPGCQACGRPATFRCAGRACHRSITWCDQHRRPHPRDRDLDYCPSCYEKEFPPCTQANCHDIGTVVCEHMTPEYQRCGRRMCTLHAYRWQVFGSERIGLGRCSYHAAVSNLPPGQLIFQIVAGAMARRRRERLPSLQGFAHTLRNCEYRELALDYPGIYELLRALPLSANITRAARQGWDRDVQRPGIPAGQGARLVGEIEHAMKDMDVTWRKQLQDTGAAAAEGERLLANLKRMVLTEDPRYGSTIAAALTLAEYRPARVRDGQVARSAMLFVNLPENLRGLFMGRERVRGRRYSELLGVEVRIEGGQRRR